MSLIKKHIPHGIQFRDSKTDTIVNWFQKKGTVFVQKNPMNLKFPTIAFNQKTIEDIFNKTEFKIPNKPTQGICSDAGTHGNPGESEYQVTDLNGTLLKHEHLGIHSNNYAELMGILGSITYAIDHQISEIWTDSMIGMTWIESGKVGKNVNERDLILDIVDEIQTLLNNHPIKINKWLTDHWGEIPADFGRK